MAGRDGARSVARDGPVVCRARPLEVSPWRALRAFAGPRFAWAPPNGPIVVGCGVAERVTSEGPGRFDAVRSRASSLFSTVDFTHASGVERPVPSAARPRLLGGFAFHGTGEPGEPWRGFPAAAFVLPRFQFVASGGRTWVTAATVGDDTDPEATEAALSSAVDRVRSTPSTREPPPGIADVRRNPSRTGWRDQVRSILRRIRDGEVEKVVLGGTLTARLRGPVRLAGMLSALAERAPACHRFAVDPGLGATFFGATPERLVDLREGRIETHALAGSVGRGGTDAADARLEVELTDTPRLRREHDFVADAVRDSLAEVAGDVTVGELGVRKLDSVQHLETPITAQLREPRHVTEIVAALHPTPAVGGLPPVAASRVIRETEPFDRGWYAGPVGWFDASGDGSFAVGIRSAVAHRGEVTLYAGNGIVPDSDPDQEWDELQLKYRPMLDQLRA